MHSVYIALEVIKNELNIHFVTLTKVCLDT